MKLRKKSLLFGSQNCGEVYIWIIFCIYIGGNWGLERLICQTSHCQQITELRVKLRLCLMLYFFILISIQYCFPRKETEIRKWKQKDTPPKSRAQVEAMAQSRPRGSLLVPYTMMSLNLGSRLWCGHHPCFTGGSWGSEKRRNLLRILWWVRGELSPKAPFLPQ